VVASGLKRSMALWPPTLRAWVKAMKPRVVASGLKRSMALRPCALRAWVKAMKPRVVACGHAPFRAD
jgi:hypothetical protein